MRMTLPIRRGERGAVLILVAAFAIVAVVFLAFVIDIGNQRQDRRQFTTATDASALDVAQDWANARLASTTFPAGDCSAAAQEYLERNRAEAPDGYTCTATKVNGRLGAVTVSANGTVDYQMAPAIGIDEGGTASSTSVRVRSTAGGGLRPFAVCASESPALEAWIDSQSTGAPLPPTDLIIGGPKFLPSNCGENNGNWGMVAFPSQDSGVGNINGDGLAGVLARGTNDQMITIDLTPTGDPETECAKSYEVQAAEEGVACVFQETGNPWTNDGVTDAFDYLEDEGIVFNLPVYGDRVAVGGGSGTGFPIVGYLEVELISYCGDDDLSVLAAAQVAIGACKGGADNFVHVQLNKLSSGNCCDVNKDNRILEICDVGDLGGGVVTAELLQNCQTADGVSGPPPSVPEAACTPTSVTPLSQVVPVDDTGRSTVPATVALEVLDPDVCGSITVEAVPGSGAPVAGSVTGPVGNAYTATFTTGTTFAATPTTYAVRFADGGAPLDDSAGLETEPIAPCGATAPSYAPPQRAPQGKSGYSNDLVSDLVVSTSLSNVANCSPLTIKVFHPNLSDTLTVTPPTPLGTSASGTFAAKNPSAGWKWSGGTYTVRVERNGVPLPGAISIFTLPS